MVEKVCEMKAKKAIENMQAQITFRKKVLQQKFSNKKLLQLWETGEKGYKKYDLDTLKSHLCDIFEELPNPPKQRANEIFCRVKERKTLDDLKEELRSNGDERLEKETTSQKKV